LRAALERRFLAYAEEAHPGGTSAVYAREGAEGGGGSLTVCVGTLEVSKENFWQGHSRSEWRLEVAGPALQLAACSGECAVCVLSFEDGSVQMDFAKEYSGTATTPACGEGSGEGVEAAAEACIAAIETHERAFLAELESQFENFDAVFRDLRRALPVSRTKFNWNTGVHRMANQLKVREQKLSEGGRV